MRAGGISRDGGGASFRRRETGAILVLFFLLALSALLGGYLSRRHPNIMEARNFLCARDILRGGDWLFPAMDGEVRLQKPPLPTWLSAAGSLLLGEGKGNAGEGAAMRFPAFLAALAGLFLVFLLARDWGAGPAEAALAACAAATSWAYVQWGVLATWDVYAYVFGLGGVVFLDKALRAGKGLRAWWGWALLSILFWGAAGWSKGPVAFFALFLPYLATMLLLKESRRSFPWGRAAAVLVPGLILGGLWWGIAWFSHGQSREAFRAEAAAWGTKHLHGFLYYMAGLPRYTLPWSFLLLAALGGCWKRRGHLRSMAVWFLAGLILLSLVPEKKFRYALPLVFPMGLLVGAWMARETDPWEGVPRWVRGVCNGHRALLILVGPAGAGGLFWAVRHGASPLFLLGAPFFLFVSWAAWKKGWRPFWLGGATAGAGALAAALLLPAMAILPRFQNRFREFALAGMRDAGLPLYSLEPLSPCMSWALDPKGRLTLDGPLPEGSFRLLAREEESGKVEKALSLEGRGLVALARPVYWAGEPETFVLWRVSGKRKGGEAGKGRSVPGGKDP